MPLAATDAVGQHAGECQQADHVHDLDQRVDGRAGRVLERIADGIAGDAGLVLLRALAGELGTAARSSIIFLALSQAPPALAMKTASSWPERIMPARKPPRA